MKIYYDAKFAIISNTDENTYVIYSTYSHSVIKLPELSFLLFKKIIETIQMDGNLDLSDIETDINKHKDIEAFIQGLEKNKILFTDIDSFENADYKNIIEAGKVFRILDVYVHLTQRCNLDCTYCYNKKNLNKWQDISINSWKKCILELKEQGLEKVIITGGEPFLSDNLIELCKYVKDLNLQLQILTNGTLIENKVEVLELADKIIISLDAIDPNKNNLTRKNSIKYDLVNILRHIKPLYKKKITINSVITQKNLHTTEELRKFIVDDLGYNIRFMRFCPNDYTEISLVPQKNLISNEEDYAIFEGNVIKCPGAFNTIAINSNGDVYPCQNLVKSEFFITNIKENNWLSQLNYSDVTKTFMDLDVDKIEECKDCLYKYICGGGCRAKAYCVYGQLDAYLKFECKYLKENCEHYLKKICFE